MTASPEDFIGLSGPEFAFPVELGKNREFAGALHAFQPVYNEGGNPVMFPTLPIVAGYLWGYMLEEPRGTELEKLGMADKMSLDGEQEFLFFGEKPRAGDTLAVRTWVDDIRKRTGRRGGRLNLYRMRTDFRDAASGALRITLYSTSVVPENLPEDVPPESGETATAHMSWNEPRDQFMAIRPADAAALAPGDRPEPVTMPPHTLTDCVRYQITTGNYGASHHDRNAAVAEGFPTWFGVGMYHAGLLANFACAWLGVERLTRFKARFLDATWPGDVLTYAGEVAEIAGEDARRIAKMELSCSRGASPAVAAWADFDVT